MYKTSTYSLVLKPQKIYLFENHSLIFYANHKFLAKGDLTNIGLSNKFVDLSIVLFLFVFFLILLGYMLLEYRTKKKSNDTIMQKQLLEQAAIAGRKNRSETKSIHARIVDIMMKTFGTVKIVENLAVKCGDTECIIPMIGITPKGILLFQFVDYPGKAVFGQMKDKTWSLAQSDKCAQEIPNAMFTAFELAMLVKQETDIDVKPIVVISQYTMAETSVYRNSFRFNIVTEDNVLHELNYMKRYSSNKQLTGDFMENVKARLLQLDADSRS